jgi:hypothetical protein
MEEDTQYNKENVLTSEPMLVDAKVPEPAEWEKDKEWYQGVYSKGWAKMTIL